MENLVKLYHGWEIQLLVLLSFAIQIFLFFTGGLRRRSINMLLRLSIWVAYLGADMIAVYALGYLSQHEGATSGRDTITGTHPLAFFWAPFLLTHLGGQDTITAFAMEDNNLWLRHLLNLMVQVILALYVFWKSIGRHSVEFLVSGIFLFIAGILKYGERTWSLKCGSYKSLESSTGDHCKHQFPELVDGDVGYSNVVCTGLRSMLDVFNFFAGRTLFVGSQMRFGREGLGARLPNQALKVLGIELGMMYDDLYTKALVLRTRSGLIIRCISQISALVAFILFFVGNKYGYSRADVAITYSLFVGGFFLEVCAVFIFMMSPWTWAWFKAQKYDRLARFSWSLFSSGLIGWPEKGPLWSNAMGQYNLRCWFEGSDQPTSCGQRVMSMTRKLAKSVGAKKEKIFWLSKLLDTEYVKADKVMECLEETVVRFVCEPHEFEKIREWPNLDSLLRYAQVFYIADFGFAIVFMHMFTEQHLSKYPCSDVEADVAADIEVLVEVCRKLSRYMMHLLVTLPSLLPLNASAVGTLDQWQADMLENDIMTELKGFEPQPGKEALEEIKEVWVRLVIYAAAKSQPEIHAAQLARGGEALSFVWLQLAHYNCGDFGFSRMELTRDRSKHSVFYVLQLQEVVMEGTGFPG
ncbi:uncharacterized protein LOC100832216 [Brachypodium distachyon]|uniref:DUF4220 domain-containing protein n=1 Tax=Brachypodium distachyon TaxID=15368 RepID=I1H9K8_BRADI|nr:uncharacterized protein LOC100832216 [Brachypodium distachyon]KQK23580.1 hypothetical protein BRADI_1g74730v3 [Brachypodium distachyon]PNT78168.1 hypothetical protein BRADI_1g74730v3 [Brachypodium distachyon]|eukprot:XP_010229183.1 uncharacterized protein LOC100832216 [Brachypodium distachyon]